MTDLGGESACWAHLVDELDTREQPDRVTYVDLTQFAREGSGALWSLPHDGDLDANLVHLVGGEEIGHHVNHEVDVFVVVVDGAGELDIDERTLSLRPGVVSLIPRGTSRAIRADGAGVSYLTVHRHRGPLAIGRR